MKFLSFVVAFSCVTFALALSDNSEKVGSFSSSNDVAGTSPVTSPMVTTTKPKADLPVNNYNFTKNDSVCLLAHFAGQFVQKKGNETNKWNVDKDANVDKKRSDCNKLVVVFHNGEFTIDFGHDKTYTFINKVTADLKDPTTHAFAANITQAKVTYGSSYLCESGFVIDMSNNVTFKMTKVQLQPIYVSENKFGTVENCNDLSGIVPIIVGAVLAGLVVIVVVAYFIGRSRNRTGYEEI